MPVSKGRRRPPPKRRNKAKEIRAKETQVAQEKAEARRMSPAAYRRRRALGWTLVVLAVVVVATHFFEHMGMIGFASQGVEDLIAGFPMGLVLGVVGAIVLSN